MSTRRPAPGPAPRKERARRVLQVLRRQQAEDDINQIVDHYLGESADLALAFIDALESAVQRIARWPGTGSPRYAVMLSLGVALRHWPATPFPYLIVYVELADHVEIWRVLHEQRDIPRRIRETVVPGADR